jgi:hypothetical protein
VLPTSGADRAAGSASAVRLLVCVREPRGLGGVQLSLDAFDLANQRGLVAAELRNCPSPDSVNQHVPAVCASEGQRDAARRYGLE